MMIEIMYHAHSLSTSMQFVSISVTPIALRVRPISGVRFICGDCLLAGSYGTAILYLFTDCTRHIFCLLDFTKIFMYA